ncbi:MAG: ABC transporter permease subunit [Acidimicrobiia bacterium]|nr:ABC transporter permease subunit [Acidimicrobiia bacterium]
MTAVTPPIENGRDPFGFVTSTWFPRMLFPVVVLAVWTVVYFVLDSLVFPSPLQVLSFMWDEITLNTLQRTNLYATFGISLARLFVGFAISMVIGTTIGLSMGLSKSVDAFFHDWIMAILAMPALVWALFAGLVFGFGHTGPVLVTVLAGIPFVIVNVREGVRNTPRELFDMARSFNVPQNRTTRHLLMPSLMPFFFAAMRYGFSIGWKGLVLAEVFASDQGAGWTIKFWYDAHRAHGVIAYALFFIVFALFLEKFVFDRIYEKAFRWRPQVGGMDLPEQEAITDTDRSDVDSDANQTLDTEIDADKEREPYG